MTSPHERGSKPRYLPEVTQDAIANVGTEIGRFGWAAYKANTLFVMRQANPHLLTVLESMLTKSGAVTTPEEATASEAAMVVTHQMLAGQARIDDADKDPSKYRLPTVQPDTVDAFKADIQEQGVDMIGARDIHALASENGHLETMVTLFLRGSSVEGRALSVAQMTMQATYTLLDIQAQADAMNSQL